MLAIPVLRDRVAPVLNWCSSIRIYPEKPASQSVPQELNVSHLEAGRRLEFLREQGVKTLICGALSPDLRHYAQVLGITVVCGVAGDIEEVLRSYWSNQLDQPRFYLPGCRGPRRYQSGFGGGRCPGLHREPGPGRGAQASPAGSKTGRICICPECGHQQSHERGIPCHQVHCPRCGQRLVRG
jgi:predicted Fe-Mo cluster-binding NifX family protein|uniref:Dinitrogenase iron-molybdenum cofactor biosynthesis domain-containing protein n=1 Tax=Desulfobacca acetoxidans TaxID=60893 RepID=A0A7V6A4P4_9BACT